MKKQHNILLYCILGFILFYGFFYHLGSYPLLDVDETRYVDMARDMFYSKNYLTLYLNGDYFFEKPPLYFWIECLAFKLSGAASEFSARLPIVLLSLMPVGLLFSLCEKIRGKKFAFITAAVLLTSLEYMFLTKIAILDSVLTSFVTSSVLCYFYTFYAENKNKKYFWIFTYIFSGLAVMAKGIPGIAIPAIIISVSTILFKTYKETFKYLWGFFIFLLIILPWHLTMLKTHSALFFDEYIIKHHILRFLGSDVIHRNEPWYFYILTLLWGLFPHIFVLLSKKPKFNGNKFLTLNWIAVFSILIFFSLSGAKLITYILPIYPFFAVIIGEIWFDYIKHNDKNISLSIIILNCILTLAVIVMPFIGLILPNEIYSAFHQIQWISLLILIPFVISNWIFIIRQRRLKLFLSVGILMAMLSGFLTPNIYEFNYTFGQNDLMRFAKYAKDRHYTISAYLTGNKYSLLYYGNQTKIEFKTEEDLAWLYKELNKDNNIVIVRNKKIKNLPLEIEQKGTKYSILKNL